MLVAGTEAGGYRVTGVTETRDTEVRKTLDAPRVERIRQFDAIDGVFAGTEAGLYHSADGRDWFDLHVPEEPVWAVSVSPAGERLYAGTVPARVYVSSLPADGISPQSLEWRELEGFHELPSRDEWGVPRHDTSPASNRAVSTSVATAVRRGRSGRRVSTTTSTVSRSWPKTSTSLPLGAGSTEP
jgi:hypothetical protein